MKILSAAQMREIDRKTIEEFGLPGLVLMENAGIGIVEAVRARFPHLEEERIVVVAGKGNNGGDGFVVARHFHNLGLSPTVLLLAGLAELKGDAALNANVAEKLGVEIVEIKTPADWTRAKKHLRTATIILDAIFGTGLSHPAEGLPAAAIKEINAVNGYIVAVDLPSGLSADTFRIIGPAVRADLTVALGAPKIVHLFPPSEDLVGELLVSDISIPPVLFESPELTLQVSDREIVRPFFRRRERNGHKGTYGHVLILAGSRGKTGAAVLAGKAAYRAGAGLVTVATPAGCVPVIARSMAELMTEPLPETGVGTIGREALPRILDILRGKDALVLGPGLSVNPETTELVRTLLPRVKIRVVIDADGLNILGGRLGILKQMTLPPILTPHPGEFARLLGLSVPDVLDDRLTLAPRFAKEHRAILVLKGHRTLIAGPDGRVFVNPTGNPGMGTGGSGDVLSGIVAALIMGAKDVFGATVAAVYVHGLSGDVAAAEGGERGLIAGDLIKHLPAALKILEDEAS
jgi:NAD(P)H-hydrate epimerase